MAQINLTITREGVGTGWKPEPADYRDRLFMDASKAKMKTMRELANVRTQTPDAKLLGPRRDQHAEGSCTGHGMASVCNRITRQDGDRYNTVYGPRFLYNMARIIEGGKKDANGRLLFDADGKIVDPGPWINIDAGAYVRDVMKAAAQYGATPESNWKYRARIYSDQPAPGDTDYKKVPTPSRFKSAQRFRLEYHRCQTVEEILSALAANHPIVFGFACFSNMWTPEVDRTGVIPMPGGSNDGGHCVSGHWYNLDFPGGGVVFGENSWSAWWGRESPTGIPGMITLPLEFWRRGWADDTWAAVKEAA